METLIEDRRQELADFLKRTRARLNPQDFGLPSGRRRRVPGLRREEVAELADISATWYSWLEQARTVNYSVETLERLATALKLEPSEKEYVFGLAGHTQPPQPSYSDQSNESIKSVLSSLSPSPAYVHKRSWDVVMWNDNANKLFGPFESLPEEERNMLWLAFTEPTYRERFKEWKRFAQCALNHYRAEVHLFPEHGERRKMVQRLLVESPEFQRWWPRHDVKKPTNWQKVIRHDAVGEIYLDPCEMQLSHKPGLLLTVLIPAGPADRAKLEALAKL